MPQQYHVTAKKKDGTVYEGLMTTKEPQLVNGLYAIASESGDWRYIQPDEISEINFVRLEEQTS